MDFLMFIYLGQGPVCPTPMFCVVPWNFGDSLDWTGYMSPHTHSITYQKLVLGRLWVITHFIIVCLREVCFHLMNAAYGTLSNLANNFISRAVCPLGFEPGSSTWRHPILKSSIDQLRFHYTDSPSSFKILDRVAIDILIIL